MTAVEIGIYKLSSSVYVRLLFERFISARWYVLAAVVLPFVALSFVDLRFLYVALMALFIVMPMILAFVYFYYAFSEECVFSIRRGTTSFGDKGIEREFFNDDDEPVGQQQYDWAAFSGGEFCEQGLVLFLKGKKLPFVLVPASEIPFESKSVIATLLQSRGLEIAGA